MQEIEKLFFPDVNSFMIFVVEQRFVVGKGHDYFHKYINTPNFFDSEEKTKKLFNKIIAKIESNITPASNIITKIMNGNYWASLTDIVSALCKLFSVTEHQAAGPEIIDPIIIQEGKISKRSLTKIINIHKDSILRPSIIILLKDNDFERAKELLSECPSDIKVKMIRNSGEITISKIINCGSNDVESFITSFSEHCYSTCANTKIEVLLNSSWVDNNIISSFSPLLFRYRSNLLLDQKTIVRSNLTKTITDICIYPTSSEKEEYLIKSLECVAKLYRVFCNDYGGKDLVEAYRLATQLNNEILLAQVYKCADLLPNCSLTEKIELYEKACSIFTKNRMEDHAIYSKNNLLIEQFYTNSVFPEQFKELYVEAINNVPGMIGVTHIFNNAGVAFLYSGFATDAIDTFNKGLEYASCQHRIVQKLALESNKMIAESYSFQIIDENRIRSVMRQIFDGMGVNTLPFLGADYALNVLSVSLRQNQQLAKELLEEFPFNNLVNASFSNMLCASERILQMQYLTAHYPNSFPLLSTCNVPKIKNAAKGKRKEFIERYGFNPFDFSTWM